MAVFTRNSFCTCNKMMYLEYPLLLEQLLRKKLHLVLPGPPFYMELKLLIVHSKEKAGNN